MLRQLKGIFMKLSTKLTLIRSEPIFDLGQLGARLFRDLDDVEGRIDVAGHHRLIWAQDDGTRYRAAGILVEFKPPGVFLFGPLGGSLLVVRLLRGR